MVDPKLLTLIEVEKRSSFTAAAKALNLTQPAVSQHIHMLEKETGIRIFNKVGTSLRLTPEGEILLRYAKRIVSIYRELASKLKDEARGKKGYIVGITHTAEANLIAEVLASYASEHPGTRIKIKTDAIKNLYDKLSSYEIDLAVVDGPLPNKKYSSILLDTDSLVAVMSKHHRLAFKRVLTIDDLKKEFPTWRFEEVDTLAITGLSKAIIEEALPLYEKGASLDEVKKAIEDARQHFAITLFADDLKFFKASGRVSGISAFLGGALGIKPIISIDKDGYMKPVGKVAGKKKAFMTIIEDIEKKGDDIANHPFLIVHSDISKELLDYLRGLIVKHFGDIKAEEIIVSPVGGSHAGPDCLGIAFHAKHR